MQYIYDYVKEDIDQEEKGKGNTMNTNLIHNVLNVAMAVTAGATAFMVATGCTTNMNGALDCSASWIPVEYSTIAVTVMAVSKMVINIARDGFKGLTKRQPPVQ